VQQSQVGDSDGFNTTVTCAPAPRRLHDERIEAACFDAMIRSQYSDLAGEALNMSRQVESYLGDGPPRTPSAIRLLVYQMGDIHGKNILDLGCGTGDLSIILARRGARVTGIDVSSESINVTRRRTEVNHVSHLVSNEVMSAHCMTFPDACFDFVAGKAILHHLDLARSRDEIKRVLKKGGQGFFVEPIALSRALRFLRKLVPIAEDKETPDERQLSAQDLALFCSGFDAWTLKEVGLLSSRLERFFPRYPSWLVRLFRFDAWVLDHVPSLRKYADMVLIIVRKD